MICVKLFRVVVFFVVMLGVVGWEVYWYLYRDGYWIGYWVGRVNFRGVLEKGVSFVFFR